jgi:Ca2+ transporting ATPase
MSLDTFAPWAKSTDEVLAFFETTLERGLTTTQVDANRAKYGANTFPAPPRKFVFTMIIDNFRDPMVQVLLFSVIIGFVFAFTEPDPAARTTAFIEPWVITLILVLNAIISVLQELKAQASVESLKAFQPNVAHAVRDGVIVELDAADLVCGDIVEVGEGQQVPADARILRIKSTALTAHQSARTSRRSLWARRRCRWRRRAWHSAALHCCAGASRGL